MSPETDWKLTLVSGGSGSMSYVLTEQGVQIGRADECDITLNSQNVSRRHARVFVYQGRPYVQDLGSRNGVYVNGVRTQEQALSSGDTLTMGEFVFQVTSGADTVIAGKRRSRTLLYGGAGVLVVLVVVAALWKGTSRTQTSAPATITTPATKTSQVEDMFTTINKTGTVTNPNGTIHAGSQPATVGAQEVPVVGMATDKRNAIVREYLDRAELLQEAGKVTEALKQYKLALKLDPTCALCLTRKERLEKEIQERINKYLEDGMKSFKALRYQDAINAWEMVVNLSPDPGSQPHQLAKQYIADAEAKLAAQNRY